MCGNDYEAMNSTIAEHVSAIPSGRPELIQADQAVLNGLLVEFYIMKRILIKLNNLLRISKQI
jgi:hypothetical protein